MDSETELRILWMRKGGRSAGIMYQENYCDEGGRKRKSNGDAGKRRNEGEEIRIASPVV